MTLTFVRIYAAVTAILGAVQVAYNAMWIGRPAPPYEVPFWLLGLELGWTLVSIDFAVRLRRRRLPWALPASYAAYTGVTFAYSSWLASTSGTGTITDAMIPLGWKLGAVAVGAWFIAGGARLALIRPETR
ncbi:MAG TPA: hypothetical protein VMS56_09650 [Thermoanaerobaculia bacterium]|nr:hypothetical protein [Thermoanaerobaculia bacterium]